MLATQPRPHATMAGAFYLFCRAVKKNPERGGVKTAIVGVGGRGSCLAGQQTIRQPASPQCFAIKVT